KGIGQSLRGQVQVQFYAVLDLDNADARDVGESGEAAQPGKELPSDSSGRGLVHATLGLAVSRITWGQPPSAVRSSKLDRFFCAYENSGASLRQTAEGGCLHAVRPTRRASIFRAPL